jgi:hypothetical protein
MNQGSRAPGPSLSGSTSPRPHEGRRGRRFNSRREIDEWVAERRQVLTALVEAEWLGRHRQLSLDDRRAA